MAPTSQVSCWLPWSHVLETVTLETAYPGHTGWWPLWAISRVCPTLPSLPPAGPSCWPSSHWDYAITDYHLGLHLPHPAHRTPLKDRISQLFLWLWPWLCSWVKCHHIPGMTQDITEPRMRGRSRCHLVHLTTPDPACHLRELIFMLPVSRPRASFFLQPSSQHWPSLKKSSLISNPNSVEALSRLLPAVHTCLC